MVNVNIVNFFPVAGVAVGGVAVTALEKFFGEADFVKANGVVESFRLVGIFPVAEEFLAVQEAAANHQKIRLQVFGNVAVRANVQFVRHLPVNRNSPEIRVGLLVHFVENFRQRVERSVERIVEQQKLVVIRQLIFFLKNSLAPGFDVETGIWAHVKFVGEDFEALPAFRRQCPVANHHKPAQDFFCFLQQVDNVIVDDALAVVCAKNPQTFH